MITVEEPLLMVAGEPASAAGFNRPLGKLWENQQVIAAHNHDEAYSAVDHNHDADYSPLGHDHAADYAALTHNHDEAYSAVDHNHDADYSPLGHDHAADYAALTHNHDDAYSAIGHNHDSQYAALDHEHDLSTGTSAAISLSATSANAPDVQVEKVLLFAQKIIVEGTGNDANTLLLLHGQEPLENVAVAGAAESITNNGVEQSSNIVLPGLGATTLYFDGASDIKIPSGNFIIGASDYTLDFWAYPLDLTGDHALISLFNNGIIIHSISYGGIRLYSGGQLDSPNNVFLLNQWHHICACRSGATLRFFINGVLVGSKAAPDIEGNSSPLAIGEVTWIGGVSKFLGYLTEVRLATTAYYLTDATFTPPSVPYESIAAQVLNVKFENGHVVQLASML